MYEISVLNRAIMVLHNAGFLVPDFSRKQEKAAAINRRWWLSSPSALFSDDICYVYYCDGARYAIPSGSDGGAVPAFYMV
jgi:hypothetical protein